MSEIQEAALVMGVDAPLFPARLYLVCVGCDEAITGRAHLDDAGWLCDECAEAAARAGEGAGEQSKETRIMADGPRTGE